MKFTELLKEKRSAVLDRWIELVLKSYSPQASKFMGSEKDRFSNPVGHSIRSDIETLFGIVTDDRFEESSIQFPETLVKVRAVQDFSPSEAIGFVFQLKTAINDVAGADGTPQERQAVDSRIDRLALLAFDEYVRCREKIFQIRVGEIQRRYAGHAGDPVADAPKDDRI